MTPLAAHKVRRCFQPLADIRTEDDAIRATARLKSFLYAKLDDHGFEQAKACFQLVDGLKNDTLRDDKKTPAILHEMTQALYTLYLMRAGYPLPDPEELLCVNFGHDLAEDFGLSESDLKHYLDGCATGEGEKNAAIARQLWAMTKKFQRRALFHTEGEYLEGLAEDPVTVIGKLTDHIHNLATAPRVMSGSRLERYHNTTVQYYDQFMGTAYARHAGLRPTLERVEWLMARQLDIIRRELETLWGKTPASSAAFNRASREGRFTVADPGFPAGLGPLAVPAGRVARPVDSDAHGARHPDGIKSRPCRTIPSTSPRP